MQLLSSAKKCIFINALFFAVFGICMGTWPAILGTVNQERAANGQGIRDDSVSGGQALVSRSRRRLGCGGIWREKCKQCRRNRGAGVSSAGGGGWTWWPRGARCLVDNGRQRGMGKKRCNGWGSRHPADSSGLHSHQCPIDCSATQGRGHSPLKAIK